MLNGIFKGNYALRALAVFVLEVMRGVIEFAFKFEMNSFRDAHEE